MTTPIREAMRTARRTACHLELRDSYGVAEEDAELAAWVDGTSRATDAERARRKGWLETVATTVGRGVEVRRLRIVSEPVSRYIRFEHAGTDLIIEAGEVVRWLPRRNAADLAIPQSTSGYSTMRPSSSTTSPATGSGPTWRRGPSLKSPSFARAASRPRGSAQSRTPTTGLPD